MKYRLLILVLLPLAIFGETATVEECQRWAESHYPQVRQYDLVRQTTDYSVQNARLAWAPQITFSAQATYQSDVTAFPDEMMHLYEMAGLSGIHGLPKDQYRIALDVNQTIWDGGATSAKVKIARAEGEVTEAQVATEIYQLKERINGIFFGALLLQEQLKQNAALQELLKDNIRRVSALQEGGLASVSDVQQLQAELLTAEQGALRLESSKTAFLRILQLFTGHEIDSLVAPQGEAVFNRLQGEPASRPELTQLNKQSAVLLAQSKLVTASVMPQIGLFAQGFYGNPGMNLFKDMTQDKWTLNGLVGVRLTWRISNFYTYKVQLKKIALQQHRLNVQRDNFLFNNNIRTAEQEQHIAQMEQLSRKDAEIVQLRTAIRQNTEVRVEEGVATISDLLQKITAENQAKIDQSIHQIEWQQYMYNLQITNGL